MGTQDFNLYIIDIKFFKRMKKILFVFALFSLFSCSQSKMLLSGFKKHKCPLNYLHDSKIMECDKSQTLSFNTSFNSAFDSITSARKLKGKVLPFLVYNYVEVNFNVKLGQDFVNQDYSDFFNDSFKKGSERTGYYSVVDGESDYSLEISLDSCCTNAKYKSTNTVIFLFIAYSMSMMEYGFPSATHLCLDAKLTKGGNVLFTKKYNIENIQPFVQSGTMAINKLRRDFVSNMAESLSQSTKNCIEQIIGDVNSVISEERSFQIRTLSSKVCK